MLQSIRLACQVQSLQDGALESHDGRYNCCYSHYDVESIFAFVTRNMGLPSIIVSLFAGVATASGQSPQELINSLLDPAPGTSHYSSYSSQIYYNATIFNESPIASTNYYKLEASAKLRLDPAAYDYAAGGAGLETTVANNRAAFSKVCRSET